MALSVIRDSGIMISPTGKVSFTLKTAKTSVTKVKSRKDLSTALGWITTPTDASSSKASTKTTSATVKALST